MSTLATTDAVHARGCHGEDARPSAFLPGYRYCPGCERMIRDALAVSHPDGLLPTLEEAR